MFVIGFILRSRSTCLNNELNTLANQNAAFGN